MAAKHRWVALVVLGAAVACGEPEDTPGSAYVGAVQPANVSAVLNLGDRAHFPLFRVRLVGDYQTLQASQLYVGVEDLGGLAQSFAFGLDGQDVVFQVTGLELGSLAPRSGALVFHVCLDEHCAQELQGSPSTATYAYTMVEGFALDAPGVLELAADFGEDLPPVDLPFTPPANLAYVQVVHDTCRQTYTTRLGETTGCAESPLRVPVQLEPGVPAVRLDPWLGSPGVYEDDLEVRAVTRIGTQERVHTRALRVRLTIRAQGGPDAIFFAPEFPSADRIALGPEGFVAEVGGWKQGTLSVGWFTKGQELSWTEVAYDAPPEGADPLAPYASWYAPSSRAFDTCDVTRAHCLAPGAHRAVVKGIVRGPNAQVSLPLTLKVGP